MIVISNLGPLHPLELPTNMTYLLTSLTTHIPRTPPPQVPRIDMPAEEFYPIHTTNLNRPPNVSSITPGKATTSTPTGRPNPRRSAGHIFLPANIYKLLSDVAIKELKKHTATTRSTPPTNRAVNTHDTDHQTEHPPTGHPPPPPPPPRFPCTS